MASTLASAEIGSTLANASGRGATVDGMAGVEVIWARAPTIEKLQKELADLLEAYAPQDVVGVSHCAVPVSGKESGGIWGGRRLMSTLEYSAVVLLRGE